MSKAGEQVAGRFLLRGAVCESPKGAVFYAWDLQTNVPVAVKLLRARDPEDVIRFEREASLLARIDSPGVIKCVGGGTTDRGEPYLVMEWVEGVTLRWRLRDVGLTVREAVTVGRRLAGSLAAAHRQEIVHRDLKPENILLAGGMLKRIMLIDFGVARPSLDASRLTVAGTIVGTPGYMSPEQARGDVADTRSDVFSLGCVLYECLTGRPAFAGRNVAALRAKALLHEPPPVSALCAEAPAGLVDVVTCMLHKEPGRRLRDGVEVALALAAIRDLPRGPRRPARRFEVDTLVQGTQGIGPEPMDAVVLVGPARDADAFVSAAAALGAELDVLADRSMIARLRGGDAALRAARLALWVGAHQPGAPVVLTTISSARAAETDAALDWAVGALRRDQVLCSATVTTDARTARMLEPYLRLTSARSGEYVCDGWR